jgi:hypothetical protein
MNSPSAHPMCLLSFGDADNEVWGAALQAGGAALQAGDAATLFVSRAGRAAATDKRQIEISEDDEGWRVCGTGFDLRFTAVGDDGRAPSSNGDELCHVEGRVTLPEGEREVRCPGTVTIHDGSQTGRVESLRAVTGWLGEDRGWALRALRADDRQDQEHDVVLATLFDPDGWIPVEESRLSTTFRPGEQPARASLELWVGDGDELYPRRAAAEALAPPSEALGDRLRLSLTPLLCHAGGLDGTGVYLIAHF